MPQTHVSCSFGRHVFHPGPLTVLFVSHPVSRSACIVSMSCVAILGSWARRTLMPSASRCDDEQSIDLRTAFLSGQMP